MNFYASPTTRRTLMVFFFALSLCVCLSSAHAATEASTTPLKERIEARQETRNEFRDERRSALTSTFHDRITNLAQNVHQRGTAALERLGNIIGRLGTRIEKLKALGIDTSAAEAKLTEATAKLNEASGALTASKSAVAGLGGDAPQESFATLRASFTEAREHIMATQVLLRETITLLKEAISAKNAGGVSDAVSNNEASTATSTNE